MMSTLTEEPQAMIVSECPSYYFNQVVFQVSIFVVDVIGYSSTGRLQVEDTLFRVPRRYFEQESEIFRTMFQLPVANDTAPDGSSNEKPLLLEGVNKEDFRQLLRVMFPECVDSCHMFVDPFDLVDRRLLLVQKLSVPQGISVLKLSAMWQMDNLTDMVVQQLSNLKGRRGAWIDLLDLASVHQLPGARVLAIQKIASTFNGRGTDKVVLGRQHGVKEWLEGGLRELVQREDSFTDEDDEALGWKTVSKLYRIRERIHFEERGHHLHVDEGRVVYDVKKEFEKELNEMDGEMEID